jgi:predicted RNA-binding Zn-ribbon protein involved in translation (DUF1610 family)
VRLLLALRLSVFTSRPARAPIADDNLKRPAMASDTEGMSGAFDLFDASLAVIVVVIVAVIVRAVRLTNASIVTGSQNLHLRNPDAARSLGNRIRERQLPCPQCGDEMFALLGTANRYKCDACDAAFEGPPHMSVGNPASTGLTGPG